MGVFSENVRAFTVNVCPPYQHSTKRQMFAGGGKKGKSADKEGASRFKKDIITYKNQALQPVRVATTVVWVAGANTRRRHFALGWERPKI